MYTIIPELQGPRHEDPKIKDSLSCVGRPCLTDKAQDLVTVSVKSVPKLSDTWHTTGDTWHTAGKQRTLGWEETELYACCLSVGTGQNGDAMGCRHSRQED